MRGPRRTPRAPADSPAAGKVRAQGGAQGRGGAQRVWTLTVRTLIGYVEAKSGRRILLTVMMANIPFRPFADVDAIVDDNGEHAAAIQQAF